MTQGPKDTWIQLLLLVSKGSFMSLAHTVISIALTHTSENDIWISAEPLDMITMSFLIKSI